MFGFIKRKILHRFILVDLKESIVSVHIYDIKDSKVLSQVSEDFTLEDKNEFTQELNEYINNKQEEVTKSYVVNLLNVQGQGIIPTCSASQFKEYSVDRRYIYNLCVDRLFTNYVSKIEIKWLQKLFAPVGIDLIFSPFLVLKELVSKESELDNVVLYLLYINSGVTLMIKEDDKFIYGTYFHINSDENPLHYDFDDEDEASDEEFEVDDEFDFEDDEFEEQDIDTDHASEVVNEVELIEENKNFAKNLSKSLKDYYSSTQFESNFIEKVKIFSHEKIDSSIISYIENELFLSTKTILVDIDEVVLELCEKEVIR